MINLDSDAAIAYMKRSSRLDQALQPFGSLLLSHVALGELLLGVRKSPNPQVSAQELDSLLQQAAIVLPTADTPFVYADIRAMLERKGKPIPQNDIWIAAISMQFGIPLASNDQHFEQIAGLQILRY